MNAGKTSSKIALCGILTALSVVAMIIAGFMGILTYAAPMIAGGVLIFPVKQYGKGTAFTMFAAVSLLGLMLIPDKEMALFYVLLFGHYPIIQPSLNRIGKKPARVLVKALVFNVGAALSVLLAKLIFAIPIFDPDKPIWLLAAAYLVIANICFALYASALLGFYTLYDVRLAPLLNKLFNL